MKKSTMAIISATGALLGFTTYHIVRKDATLEQLTEMAKNLLKRGPREDKDGLIQNEELIIDADRLNTVGNEDKVVAKANLTLRESPNGKSPILLKGIPKGTVLDVYEDEDKGWYMVEYEKTLGFVSKKHVEKIG